MILVKQPNNSKICGHCSVAMVSGIPLKQVISIIGHENGTFGVDLIKCLDKHNIKNSGKLKYPIPDKLPNKCILRIKWNDKSGGHFVAYKGGDIYDPSLPWQVEYNHYKTEFLKHYRGRFISYIEIL